jgi:hypothetical protein
MAATRKSAAIFLFRKAAARWGETPSSHHFERSETSEVSVTPEARLTGDARSARASFVDNNGSTGSFPTLTRLTAVAVAVW